MTGFIKNAPARFEESFSKTCGRRPDLARKKLFFKAFMRIYLFQLFHREKNRFMIALHLVFTKG
jgi:hypothetical protein